MRVSATVCPKGGVGKPTTIANLGDLLANAGLRILLIDLNFQPTLSFLLRAVTAGPRWGI